jgi:hypothetical protein
MHWKKQIVGVCLWVALLTPTLALAIPLSVYEQAASDPSKQNRIFKDAYAAAVARTLVGLRDEHFPDGKQKITQRIARDKKLADIVEGMVGEISDEQTGALVIMIDQYAKAQPQTELEDVIIGFLFSEAKKKLGEGQ